MNTNKKIKTLEFKLSKILNGGLFGAYKSKFHGSGMEFSEHKEYTFGDSLRDIDWKTYNKTDTLYVKKYEEERDLNVLFVLDNSKSMQFGSQEKTKKEILEESFYSLAMSAYMNNDNIGAFIFDEKGYDFIEPKKSKENIYRIFQKMENDSYDNKLLFFTPNPLESFGKKQLGILKDSENKIENILNIIFKRNIKNNLIFILTDESEMKNEKLIKLIGRENELVYVNIYDDFEFNLAEIDSGLSLFSGKNYLNIDLSNQKKVIEYKNNINKKFYLLNEFFGKNKVGYINLNTNSDIFKNLLLYFYKVKY